MLKNKRFIMSSRFFARFLIFIFLLLLLQSIIFGISYIALIKNKPIDFFGITNIQKNIYFEGYRNIWQSNEECVDFDEELIYIPRHGSCNFKNPEFDTTLDFYNLGRKNENNFDEDEIKNNGIVVLGDSFAMGWGVENNETFSSLLEKELKRKVYNLAVSSYATYREFLRFNKSKLIDSVDTIIIQYNPNDLKENLDLKIKNKDENREIFEFIVKNQKMNIFKRLKFILGQFKSSFRLMFLDFRNILFKKKTSTLNFDKHYVALIKVLKKFKNVKNKNIIFFNVDKEIFFYNYPEGFDKTFSNINFINISLTKDDFFLLDGHLNSLGHQNVANQLKVYLK